MYGCSCRYLVDLGLRQPGLPVLNRLGSLLNSIFPKWPPYRAILRHYRCDTPYRTILCKGVQRSRNMVRYPSWHLVSHRHICAIPHFAIYRVIIVRYPIKTNTRSLRYYRYKHCAIWKVPLLGLQGQWTQLPQRLGSQGLTNFSNSKCCNR